MDLKVPGYLQINDVPQKRGARVTTELPMVAFLAVSALDQGLFQLRISWLLGNRSRALEHKDMSSKPYSK